ncbi:MAG: hypothetical protein Q4D45_00970 [Lachnospiraceae bacterium]|nr:hypothetical protein [Lachnospiraceae bacterium]
MNMNSEQYRWLGILICLIAIFLELIDVNELWCIFVFLVGILFTLFGIFSSDKE